jgi:hypothetical protein
MVPAPSLAPGLSAPSIAPGTSTPSTVPKAPAPSLAPTPSLTSELSAPLNQPDVTSGQPGTAESGFVPDTLDLMRTRSDIIPPQPIGCPIPIPDPVRPPSPRLPSRRNRRACLDEEKAHARLFPRDVQTRGPPQGYWELVRARKGTWLPRRGKCSRMTFPTAHSWFLDTGRLSDGKTPSSHASIP